MIEELAKHLPLNITEEHLIKINKLKEFDAELYKELRDLAKNELISMDWWDKSFCKKHGIDYVNFLKEENIIRLMIAYLGKKEKEK